MASVEIKAGDTVKVNPPEGFGREYRGVVKYVNLPNETVEVTIDGAITTVANLAWVTEVTPA